MRTVAGYVVQVKKYLILWFGSAGAENYGCTMVRQQGFGAVPCTSSHSLRGDNANGHMQTGAGGAAGVVPRLRAWSSTASEASCVSSRA